MANRRLLLGVAAAAGLGAYILFNADTTLLQYLWPSVAQPGGDSPVETTRPVSQTPRSEDALNPLQLAEGDLSDMVERPLFNPTRAPHVDPPPEPIIVEAPVAVEAPPEFDPSDLTLLGVAASAGVKTAMIRSTKSDKVFHVSAGEKLLDLTVAAVGDREVTLRLDQNTYRLKLFQNPGRQPAAGRKLKLRLPTAKDGATGGDNPSP